MQRRYREPFLKAIQEGCDDGAFQPEHSVPDITHFLLDVLAGAIIPRVLHQDGPTPEAFRSLLLSQMGVALGRKG